MFSPESLDPLLDVCHLGRAVTPQDYARAETALTISDQQRREEGWSILDPWQAHAVRELLARCDNDPCMEPFTRAVPHDLRPRVAPAGTP